MLIISLGGLTLLLIAAAWGDIRSFTIPNRLNAAIAALAPLYWWGAGFALWPDVAIQIGLAAIVFAIFAAAFMFGVMGGGDVKMLAALALWLRFDALLNMLVIMSILGGALTALLLIRHRVQRREGRPEIPYGVAISLAGLTMFYEPIFNHFS